MKRIWMTSAVTCRFAASLAPSDHDAPALFDWLIEALSYQAISDSAASGYMARHGSVRWSDIAEALSRTPSCRAPWTAEATTRIRRFKGAKRHILVDMLGLLLNVVVHPADVLLERHHARLHGDTIWNRLADEHDRLADSDEAH
jgi:hypothetical protein